MSKESHAEPIGLARPDITQAEIDAVVAVMRTPYLSIGPKVLEFEAKFAQLCGTRHAVSCNSGTSALHLLVRAMNLGPGDEVITTPFTFAATANCVLFERATPVFVDVDPATWCIDPAELERKITPRTKAVIPVDVFGVIPEMDTINQIARRHGLRVIEDSCEAVGATYHGRPAGSLADAGVFGFYPNKQLTTGEGGMIVTDDDDLARLSRSIRNQGRGEGNTWLLHERLGFNFRLSDINCAIGCVQVDRLREILDRRSAVARMYNERLADDPRFRLQRTTAGCEKSWFVYVVRLTDDYGRADRDRVLEGLRGAGIQCSNYFAPLHLQPFYREDYGYGEGEYPVSEALGDRTVALPFHAFLSEGDVDRVVTALKKLV